MAYGKGMVFLGRNWKIKLSIYPTTTVDKLNLRNNRYTVQYRSYRKIYLPEVSRTCEIPDMDDCAFGELELRPSAKVKIMEDDWLEEKLAIASQELKEALQQAGKTFHRV